jgi:hypothetical protein
MANKFKIAHIKEQGQQIIIIPLDSAFGHKSESAPVIDREVKRKSYAAIDRI